jgi:hypothetical protein
MQNDLLFQNFNLAQGYNTSLNPYLSRPGESSAALNCDFTTIGSVAKFAGYASVYTGLSASDVLGLYNFKTSAGASVFLAVNGTVLYYLSGSTWTSALTGLTTGLKAEFTTHLDTAIMVNGTDVAKKSTNGSSWSTLGGTPPVAKYTVTFDNKVYMFNITSHPSRMQWSDDGTIETWTSTNFQDIITDVGSGDQITGATVNNNSLLIFKNYSTWKWDTYNLVVMDANTGCRSPRSIASRNNWTFWLSHNGVMATDGGRPRKISKQIDDIVAGITDITACVGWVMDEYYYLYVGTANGITNCLLCYNYNNNTWAYKSMQDSVKVAAILTSGSGASQFSYFGNSGGQVYKFRTGLDDNSSAIPFELITAPDVSKAPHRQKDYKEFIVFLDGTSLPGVDVLYSIDYNDFQPLGHAQSLITKLRFPSDATGYSIRIMYKSIGTKGQQKIRGHMCFGKVKTGDLLDVR